MRVATYDNEEGTETKFKMPKREKQQNAIKMLKFLQSSNHFLTKKSHS
jgi:hypothetical protein